MATRQGLRIFPGIEGSWVFNVSGSTIADDSGNGHTMTLTGASSLVAGPFGLARSVGPGPAGAGNTNYFSSPVDAAADARMLGETTYLAWVRAPAADILGAISYVPGFGTAGGESLGVMAVEDGLLYGSNGNSFGFTIADPPVPTVAWALICVRKRVVLGVGYLDYFINGVKVQTEGPFTIPLLGVANRKFWIGTNGKHWETATGAIAEVQAYAVALTDAEILEQYQRGVGTFVPGVGSNLNHTFQAVSARSSPDIRAVGKFHQFTISNAAGYLIDENNKYFDITRGGVDYTLTLEEGRYDSIVALCDAILTAANVEGLAFSHNQTIGSTRPATVAITATGSTWTMRWTTGTNADSTARLAAMLGFSATEAELPAALTQTGVELAYYRQASKLEIATAVLDYTVIKRRP